VADRFWLNVENPGFLVIDPDDYVRRHNVIFDERSLRPALVGEQTA
jgi:hypothetical protein